MDSERILSQHYVFGAAWLLLGVVIGLHFPDIDLRLQRQIPSWLLQHRSILTHGLIASWLLFWLIRSRRGTTASLRSLAIGLSLAFAVHLCFDFFPRAWHGFALIHVPLYGRTTALFSQLWILFSIVACLYVAFLLVRSIVELVLSVGNLIISFSVAALETSGAALPALTLLALATIVVVVMARQVQKAGALSGLLSSRFRARR